MKSKGGSIGANRLADSIGWEAQTDVAIHRHADMLLKMGYK